MARIPRPRRISGRRARPVRPDSTAATLHAILYAILYDELPALPCGPPLSTVITGLLIRDIKAGVQLWDLAQPAVLGLLSRNDIPGELVDSAIFGPVRQTLITTSYDNGVYLSRVSR